MYSVIGIMSGTSMDGVDLAHCEIKEEQGSWSYRITVAETIPYDNKWRIRLSQLRKQPVFIYPKTDTYYGLFLGKLVNEFIKKHNLHVDFISSHGHTVFHQPESGFTAQLGSGSAINAVTGLPVVCDFRTGDVANGGQGAPLVPMGDALLFGDYDVALNLGGFANISFQQDGERKAYDVSPANIIFNRIARNLDKAYDENGEIAAGGTINYDLLKVLNNLEYYKKEGPKSLGREWINSVFWPEVRDYEQGEKQENLMKTLVDHVAGKIADALYKIDPNPEQLKVLVTGGGAFNQTLIELMQTHCDAQFIVPEDKTIVNYKEALIFALLGVLRVKNQVNVKASYTGAKADSISGALYGDFSKIK